MSRPTLIDLYCNAGGATKGYQRAGYFVIGVDIKPQPNYCGDVFIQADALEALSSRLMRCATAVHASPPCQHWSDLAHRNGNAADWPDLITPTREALRSLGIPYVIENVPEAPLFKPITLCGTMFPGLRVIRHRAFESNVDLTAPENHGPHPLVFTHDKRKRHYGQLDQNTSFVQVTGGGNATLANKLEAMGTPWMRTHHEVNEAIPPAYAEHIGRQLLAAT